MLVSGLEILKDAREKRYAVPAPDFWDSNSCRCFIESSKKHKMPLMLSFPEALIPFLSLEEASAIGRIYASSTKEKVCLHLDHGVNLDNIKKAIDLGFTSVMIDASMDSFEENVRKTKEIVEYAHKREVSVEAEIGHVGTMNETFSSKSESIYTDVDSALKFARETACDSLAVSIGTSHGVYENGTPHINYEVLKELRESLNVPLVLHGGSGIGDENLKKCAEYGITKINLFTDFMEASYNAVSNMKPTDWLKTLIISQKSILSVIDHVYDVLGENYDL